MNPESPVHGLNERLHLARAKDPPPGNIVMWRGLSRLNDIALGATLQTDFVGN